MTIPHSRPTISEEDISNVVNSLRTGLIAYGDEVTRFEHDLSDYIGVLGGVAVNSGTNALYLALKALDVRPGDEIIIPSYVCVSVLHSVKYAGASPVFADIESGSYNMDSGSVAQRITSKTKAIIVPHLFGAAADLDQLSTFGIPIVEDCAQAIGTEYKGRKLGSYGLLSTFSFKATKLITTGHGGMIVTNYKEMLQKLRQFSKYDQLEKYRVSYNYQLTDFQAAMGRSQLKRLSQFIERRRQISKIYSELFETLGYPVQCNNNSIFFRYVVEVDDCSQYANSMNSYGVCCEKPIFKPLHQYVNSKAKLPNTERTMLRALSIPIYPSLTNDEISRVCNTIEKVWGEKGGKNRIRG